MARLDHPQGSRLLTAGAAYPRAVFWGATGASLTVTLSKAGAAFGALAGTVSAIASGWYKVALAAGDTDTEGDLAYHVTDGTDTLDFSDAVAANSAADALLDRADAIETSLTPRQALRLITAALAGKLSGAGSTTVTIRNVGDTKDRLVATVDEDGNRSAVVADGT